MSKVKFAESLMPTLGKILFTNARIFCAKSGYDQKGDLLVENGIIKEFGKLGKVAGANIIDCKGNLLTAGLIDIQVHSREPGDEKKESLQTMSRSAVSGGVTSVATMPNTKPVADNVARIEYMQRRARESAICNVYPFAAATKNMEGKELSEIMSLAEAGAVGITDDGFPVMDSMVMRYALTFAAHAGIVFSQHAEDLTLTRNTCMNEGEVSARLGLKGAPNIAEAIIIERDLRILELVQKDYPNARYHVLHLSTAEGVEAVIRGKEKGWNVTCETAPHYFTLTDEAVEDYKTFAKMNPPLRAEKDRKAIYDAVCAGHIDAIATDHAPHDEESKRVPFAEAAYGIVGLETLLPLSLALYHKKKIALKDLLAMLTYKPAQIIGVDKGYIKKGADADLTLIDLDASWKINPEKFHSKSKNSPYENFAVKGKAIKTMVAGQIVFEA